ncbi:MAG: hypothetical protein ACXAC6_09770 [Candidatus Hodarchaeales archaeon]
MKLFACICLFLGILDLLFGDGIFGLLVFLLLIISLGGEGSPLKNRLSADQVKKVVRGNNKRNY